MKLIRELSEEVEYVVEGSETEKSHFIVGRFIVGEEKNRNGRIYPMKNLEPAVEKFVTEKVNHKTAWGELGHPATPSINHERISHRITEIKKDGNYFTGKAILIDEGLGKVARSLVKYGTIGVSTRGLGSLVEKSGIMEVQNDFRLSTIDIVTDPSGPGCFVNGIMEGVDWIFDPIKDTWFEDRAHEAVKNLKSVREDERATTAKRLRLWEDFVAALTSINISEK